ncbi:hypothetical protein Sj15T_09670 [Sphingobium sp. TA15]|uniref:Uncharacterized protein n=1 Tax=Sphingobium indicum (strain DSM 16413 / CCM 7287 / MTCC 6362 / UT26 / NBRC 101211 / UT26S) TaxID=452662 RepID=D4Z230_SPHIU|nr:hypothetical protein [Sphingobium indicum]BAI96662.1 hypothetical protein SJA_C1-18280 [Sphingobium indicum UT26S]BDD65946.1 hypothetical protein Sj15T_09670 [Sphingobium sp. TA15]
MKSIAVYFVQRLFGGPEEGSWYYDSGDLCTEPDLVSLGVTIPGEDFGRARDKASEIQILLDRDWNIGDHARPLHSVLSTGRYEAHIFDAWPPPCFPESRPTYE